MHFDRLLQAFHRSSDDRTVLASRAVEVAKVISASESAPRSGETFGRRVVQLLEMDKGDIVLEQVIQETLDWLHEGQYLHSTSRALSLLRLTAFCFCASSSQSLKKNRPPSCRPCAS